LETRIKLKGFVKVRRGLTEHLAKLSPSELKLFMAYLLQADFWDDGPDKKCLLTIQEMAKICGWSKQWTIEVKKKLTARGFIFSLKRGVVIPKFGEKGPTIPDSNGHENLTPKVKDTLPQESTILDSQGQQNLTIEVKDNLPQNSASLSDTDDYDLPKKYKELKNDDKRQEVKNSPVLSSHQSQKSSVRPLNFIKQLQEDWKKYWPDYPLISQKDIKSLLSRPLTEHDSPKLRVEFVREAIRQADQRRKETKRNPDNPVAWIFSGLHRGTQWLRDRTRVALAEKKEARIKAGYRGSKEDLKSIGYVFRGLQERGLDQGIK
jgi:hypothetical protein